MTSPTCPGYDDDFWPDDWDDDDYDDGFEDTEDLCGQWVDGGRFVCGAVGSEDCDGCPNYKYLGLTPREAEMLDGLDPRSSDDD